MIGLIIQDNQYEQDIRELLMSFYPAQTYAHELSGELDFYVETKLGDGQVTVSIWDKGEDGGWKLSDSKSGASDLSDHSATKNVIKQVC